MPLHHTFTLKIDGVPDALLVTRVRGHERVHAPFRFQVTAAADDDLDVTSLLAKRAHFAWALPDGGERTFTALVDQVEASGPGVRLTLVPRLSLLADAVDYQVFVAEDAATIVDKVLTEHGISTDKRLSRTPLPRAQCVQCFESDLDFVRRLAAEEGITLFITGGALDRIVLADHDSGWEPTPGLGALVVREDAGLFEAEESLFDVRVRRTQVPDKVTLRDYNYEKPLLDLTATAGSGALERYEYPGRYTDPAQGTVVAGLRLDELRGRRVVLTGKTSSRRLSAGHVIEIDDPRRDDVKGRWVVLEVQHDAIDGVDEGRQYEARFVAVPADARYRAARPPEPRVGGVQTVKVMGPAGAEIHSEALGRAKLHLRWDRRRPEDDTASAFARVVQPPTSGGLLFPRVGWENVVAFQHASADEPWLLGRVYNGQAVPPSGLPGKKVVSAFGTLTTPGGGGGNLVQMDDSAGSEAMNLHASKDFSERTENDKNSVVTANEAWTVGAARKLIVGQVLSTTVGGAQSYMVGASRKVNVNSDKMIAAGSETVVVGGLRTFNVGGDYKMSCANLTRMVGAAKMEVAIEHVIRSVKGAQTVLVGGTWKTVAGASHNVSVSGVSTELVAGAKSIKGSKYQLNVRGALNETLASRSVTAGSDLEEGFGATAGYSIGASAKMKASEITVKATSKITLSAGGATITITDGSVKISGDIKSSVDGADDGDEEYGD